MAGEWRYLAYMARLWTVHSNSDLVWRASVENAHIGGHCAFAGLFEFLQAVAKAAKGPAYQGELEGGRVVDRMCVEAGFGEGEGQSAKEIQMLYRKWFTVLSLFVIAALLLSACRPVMAQEKLLSRAARNAA